MNVGPHTTLGVLSSLSAADYHDDAIGDTPTLSASIAVTMVTKTPAHARVEHPRLNPDFVREEKKAWDLGTAVHSLLLEGYDRVHVVEGYDDWRTNAAKDERDEARANRRIPMLRHEWEQVSAIVDAARAELAKRNVDPPLLADGVPEQTLTWVDETFGVACRCRPDWLRNDSFAVEDVKTSARGADPEFFSRKTVYEYGYDVRAAMYLRGIKATRGVQAVWRWIVLETKPPYSLSVVTPSGEMLAIGNAKLDRALEMWRDCLAADLWPAYSREVHVAEAPPWETRWLITDELEATAWQGM